MAGLGIMVAVSALPLFVLSLLFFRGLERKDRRGRRVVAKPRAAQVSGATIIDIQSSRNVALTGSVSF
jgi:hypothetical protein